MIQRITEILGLRRVQLMNGFVSILCYVVFLDVLILLPHESAVAMGDIASPLRERFLGP